MLLFPEVPKPIAEDMLPVILILLLLMLRYSESWANIPRDDFPDTLMVLLCTTVLFVFIMRIASE